MLNIITIDISLIRDDCKNYSNMIVFVIIYKYKNYISIAIAIIPVIIMGMMQITAAAHAS